MKRINWICLSFVGLIAIGVFSCSNVGLFWNTVLPDAADPDRISDSGSPDSSYVIACDFDSKETRFTGVNSLFSVVKNPLGTGKCGCLTLKGGTDDCVVSLLDRCLDFTKNPAIIRLHVLGPKSGALVSVRLSSTSSKGPDPVFRTVRTTQTGKWEELVFDFSDDELESNWYRKMIIYFNRGKENKTPGEKWYFDDILIPDDDLTSLCLFQRPEKQRPPKPSRSFDWISNSTANPDIISPDESLDGCWWLFMRGGDGTHSRLGLYTQKSEAFNPLGPWTYYEYNPIVDCNVDGEVDNRGVIDPSPVRGKDGTIYLFYKGQQKLAGSGGTSYSTVLFATSKDGYEYSYPRIWKEGIGVSDLVIGDDGRYYLFVARRVYVFDNPYDPSDQAVMYPDLIDKGDGPANFDRYSINGVKICRLKGVDKWFMFYQGSAMHDDFPDRFHVALSDDLIHWTKVRNDQPLFTRGPRGAWDQGAIWAPEVFEFENTLYMYYEGWGHRDVVKNRDRRYFRPGHSEIGIATCTKDDFLRWCGLK